MKKWLATILLLIVTTLTAFKAEGQTITQTYIDPCDNKVYVVVIPFGQNQTVAVIRGKSKIVTLADMNSGAFQQWVNSVFATPCPINDNIRLAQEAAARAAADAAARAAADAAAKAAADAAAKAAADAAAKAAANAASGAASSSASAAASSSASAAASSAAANAATPPPINIAPPPPPPVNVPPPPASTPPPAAAPPPASSSSSPPPASGSGSSSSSSSTEAKPAEAKPAEAKPAETKSAKPAEQKQEEKKTEAKTEEKKEEAKTEEKKSEEKKTEEKKEESKKEEEKKKKEEEKKKKQEVTNPTLLASDITGAQQSDGSYLASISLGLSKSSLAGDISYSAGLVVNSNLSSIVMTGGITKMGLTDDGQLDAIHSYGTAFAYLAGNYMNLLGYTYIKPTPKKGTYGYNVGVINLLLANDDGGFDYNMATSAIAFWTKPYQYSKKLTISPQVFTMFSPISWNAKTNVSTVNRHMGFLLGAAFDYKISKRFGFSFNYKMSGNTKPNSDFLSNFLIGSRMVL